MNKYITMALVAGLMAGVSQAALQGNWGGPGVVTVSDGVGDATVIQRDIDTLKCVYDAGAGGYCPVP